MPRSLVGSEMCERDRIYMKITHLPLKNTITDEQLHLMEERFGVKAREGFLD